MSKQKPAAEQVAGAMPPARRKGAPSKKTAALLRAVCAGISVGKSTRAMCAEVGISHRVLWNWLAGDASFMQQYQRAKELCVDAYAEEIIEISDERSRDTCTDEKGREIIDREAIARSQLRIDARKWYAARLAPKKYGDKPAPARTDDTTGPAVHRVEVAFVNATSAPDGKPPRA